MFDVLDGVRLRCRCCLFDGGGDWKVGGVEGDVEFCGGVEGGLGCAGDEGGKGGGGGGVCDGFSVEKSESLKSSVLQVPFIRALHFCRLSVKQVQEDSRPSLCMTSGMMLCR